MVKSNSSALGIIFPNNYDPLVPELVNVRMIFEENKKNITSYLTPYGNILIGVDTESISVEEKENQIRVQVAYTLEANYQYLADCKIEMELRPRKEGIRLA